MRYIVRSKVSCNLLYRANATRTAVVSPQSAIWLSGKFSFVFDYNIWAVSKDERKMLEKVIQDVEDCGSHPRVVE
jgi:hypothetical protein